MTSLWWAALAAAAVLVLQLFLARCRSRVARVGAASIAIVVCTAILLSGHQPQRTRSPRPESYDALALRGLPAAVSVRPRPGTP